LRKAEPVFVPLDGGKYGLAKRHRYWARQAASFLGSSSGVVTGLAKWRVTRFAKRRRYRARQAASLLSPSSGVVTGSVKRRRYWATLLSL